MDISIEDKGVASRLKKIRLKYRPMFQQALMNEIDAIRLEAVNFLVSNQTASRHPQGRTVYNPKYASKLQPSTVGKLTSRTKKLEIMLKDKADVRGSLNNAIYIKKTAGLIIRVSKQTHKISEDYTGIARVAIDMGDSRLTNRGITARKNGHLINPALYMPKETEETLRFRFQWDKRGIRRQKRPFITPAIAKRGNKLSEIISQRIAEIHAVTRGV